MTFLLLPNSKQLVRDTWTSGIALLAEDEESTEETPPSWKRMPSSLLELVDWACVGLNPYTKDMSRQLCLVHKPPEGAEFDEGTYFPVEAHIYAFIGDHNVTPTGNWTGKAQDAHKAVQYLSLHAGTFCQQFEAQKQTIANVLALIEKHLNPRPSKKRGRDDDVIFLQRHPFSKVSSSNAPEQSSVLTVADDPLGLAKEMDKQWRVMEKVDFEYRTDDGGLSPFSHLLLEHGDFVDVTITFDIAYSRRGDHMPVPNVHLGFHRIVVLCAAKDVEKKLGNSGSDIEDQAGIQSVGDCLEGVQLENVGL